MSLRLNALCVSVILAMMTATACKEEKKVYQTAPAPEDPAGEPPAAPESPAAAPVETPMPSAPAVAILNKDSLAEPDENDEVRARFVVVEAHANTNLDMLCRFAPAAEFTISTEVACDSITDHKLSGLKPGEDYTFSVRSWDNNTNTPGVEDVVTFRVDAPDNSLFINGTEVLGNTFSGNVTIKIEGGDEKARIHCAVLGTEELNCAGGTLNLDLDKYQGNNTLMIFSEDDRGQPLTERSFQFCSGPGCDSSQSPQATGNSFNPPLGQFYNIEMPEDMYVLSYSNKDTYSDLIYTVDITDDPVKPYDSCLEPAESNPRVMEQFCTRNWNYREAYKHFTNYRPFNSLEIATNPMDMANYERLYLASSEEHHYEPIKYNRPCHWIRYGYLMEIEEPWDDIYMDICETEILVKTGIFPEKLQVWVGFVNYTDEDAADNGLRNRLRIEYLIATSKLHNQITMNRLPEFKARVEDRLEAIIHKSGLFNQYTGMWEVYRVGYVDYGHYPSSGHYGDGGYDNGGGYDNDGGYDDGGSYGGGGNSPY